MVSILVVLQGRGTTYLISISLFVSWSLTISRIHGGGVIGRRSWEIVRGEKRDLRKNHPPCRRIHTCELGWVAAPPPTTKCDRRIRFAQVIDDLRAVASWLPGDRTGLRCDPWKEGVVRRCIFDLRRRTWRRWRRERLADLNNFYRSEERANRFPTYSRRGGICDMRPRGGLDVTVRASTS